MFSKKRSSKFFFRRSLKKGLRKFSARYLAFSNEIFMIQIIVLSLAEDRAIFEDLLASRPRSRTTKCVLEDSTSDTHSKLDLNHFLLDCPASEPLRKSIFGSSLSILDLWFRPWGVARLLDLREGTRVVPPSTTTSSEYKHTI